MLEIIETASEAIAQSSKALIVTLVRAAQAQALAHPFHLASDTTHMWPLTTSHLFCSLLVHVGSPSEQFCRLLLIFTVRGFPFLASCGTLFDTTETKQACSQGSHTYGRATDGNFGSLRQSVPLIDGFRSGTSGCIGAPCTGAGVTTIQRDGSSRGVVCPRDVS